MHFPVYNKAGDIVASSITTLDVHDIARICRTYAIHSFYVVTPLKTQQALVTRIIEHWRVGFGSEYNPTRKEALQLTRVKSSLDEVFRDIEAADGRKPRTIVTDARKFPQSTGYQKIRAELERDESFLLVFGTGWGLERNLIRKADRVLDPIDGLSGYNHLPVRAAIAIILDRLLGGRPGPAGPGSA